MNFTAAMDQAHRELERERMVMTGDGYRLTFARRLAELCPQDKTAQEGPATATISKAPAYGQDDVSPAGAILGRFARQESSSRGAAPVFQAPVGVYPCGSASNHGVEAPNRFEIGLSGVPELSPYPNGRI